MSDFEVGLGLWSEKWGVSRTQYRGLKWLFSRIQHPTLERLPDALDTLKKQVRGSLPLLPLRKRAMPLPQEKLPSVATRVGVSETQAAAAAQCPQATVMEDRRILDSVVLFTSHLKSPSMRSKMFTGFGEFRDLEHTKQLWHSHAWTSSIKTTSSSCAYCHTGPPDAPASQSTCTPSPHLALNVCVLPVKRNDMLLSAVNSHKSPMQRQQPTIRCLTSAE